MARTIKHATGGTAYAIEYPAGTTTAYSGRKDQHIKARQRGGISPQSDPPRRAARNPAADQTSHRAETLGRNSTNHDALNHDDAPFLTDEEMEALLDAGMQG